MFFAPEPLYTVKMPARPDHRQRPAARGVPTKPGRRGEQVAIREVSTTLVEDLWHGDVPLVLTYWVYGFVVGIAFAMAFFAIDYFITGLDEGFGPMFILGLMLVYFVYTAFINIAIWRSASKYRGRKLWAVLAKIMVLVSWAALIREAWQIYSIAPG